MRRRGSPSRTNVNIPPVRSRREESFLLRELLLLGAEKMKDLKQDWMHIGDQLTRLEFIFILSKHIGRYGALGNLALQTVPQGRVLCALCEAFDEITCSRAEKDLADWAGFAHYLISSTKLIRPSNRSLLVSSSSFKPMELPMREKRSVTDSHELQVGAPSSILLRDTGGLKHPPRSLKAPAPKVGMIVHLPPPIDKLLVCDSQKQGAFRRGGNDKNEMDEGLLGEYRLALWLLSDEGTECAHFFQLLQEATTLLRCAEVISERPDPTDVMDEVIPENCTLATVNASQRQVLLWNLLCPHSSGGSSSRIKVLGQLPLFTEDPISVLAQTHTQDGGSILYAGGVGGRIYTWGVSAAHFTAGTAPLALTPRP